MLQTLCYSVDLERSPCEILAFETTTAIRDPFVTVKAPVIELRERTIATAKK
jgi:hypothetical protein